MRPFTRRALTKGEIALGRMVFADEIDWPRVRALQAPKLGFPAAAPFTRSIVFSHWRAAQDFTHASKNEQGWLIHELAHIWQAGRGCVLPAAKLAALGLKAYKVAAKPGACFADYNIEAQAEIARFLFLARTGTPVRDAPPTDWLEAVWVTR